MKHIIVAIALVVSLSGCYTMEYTVGKGAQENVRIKEYNHYLVYGLIPVKTTDPVTMAGGAQDYNVKISHRFFDSACCIVTYGIYCPYTVIVTK
jgi:hypothetical protein